MKTFRLVFASLSSGLDRYIGSTLTALLNEMKSVNHSQFSSPHLWGRDGTTAVGNRLDKVSLMTVREENCTLATLIGATLHK